MNYKKQTKSETPSKCYQQWYIIALAIAGISVITGLYFKSVVWGGASAILAVIVVVASIVYHKRRFMYAALGLIATLSFSGKIGLNPEMVNGNLGFVLNWGEPSSPWSVALLVALIGFLLFLDSKR